MSTIGNGGWRIGVAGPLADRVLWRRRDWHDRAVVEAVAQERRRLAADVHDLIMQDLAFTLASARAVADSATPGSLATAVVVAAERALAGARQVLGGLGTSAGEPVVAAVEAGVRTAARNVALRFDADQVPTGMEPDQPTFDALVHIAREAVTNAVRHADASVIVVTLAYADEWRLRVRDDGRGFDPGAASEGFGLESMERYAKSLCGSVQVTGAGGRGTTVEAILP